MFALNRFEWLVLTLAVLLVPELAWGQAAAGATAPTRSQSLFDRLDKNRDGYLTSDELEGEEARNRNWIAVDRNRDGRISRSEFGLVGIESAKPQPSAAAGSSAAPKRD